MTHIASLSGGQDSTAMVIRMLELGMPLDYIVFCDTGAEFDIMYEYIKKLNEYIWKKYKKCIVVLDNPIGQFKLRTYEDVTKRLKTTRARADLVGRPCGITSIIKKDACTRDLKVNRIKYFVKRTLKIDEKSVIHYNGYTYKEVLKNRGGSQERMKENYRYPHISKKNRYSILSTIISREPDVIFAPNNLRHLGINYGSTIL